MCFTSLVEIGSSLIDNGFVLIKLGLQNGVEDAIVSSGHGGYQKDDKTDFEDVVQRNSVVENGLRNQLESRDNAENEPVLQHFLLGSLIASLHGLKGHVTRVDHSDEGDSDLCKIIDKGHDGREGSVGGFRWRVTVGEMRDER